MMVSVMPQAHFLIVCTTTYIDAQKVIAYFDTWKKARMGYTNKTTESWIFSGMCDISSPDISPPHFCPWFFIPFFFLPGFFILRFLPSNLGKQDISFYWSLKIVLSIPQKYKKEWDMKLFAVFSCCCSTISCSKSKMSVCFKETSMQLD